MAPPAKRTKKSLKKSRVLAETLELEKEKKEDEECENNDSEVEVEEDEAAVMDELRKKDDKRIAKKKRKEKKGQDEDKSTTDDDEAEIGNEFDEFETDESSSDENQQNSKEGQQTDNDDNEEDEENSDVEDSEGIIHNSSGSEDDDEEESSSEVLTEEEYTSDESDEEAERNRIGNVPLEWYDDFDHIGYDLSGEKIEKVISQSEITNLLERADNPDAWKTIKDIKNQEQWVLSDADLEAIRRIRNRQYPTQVDEEEMVEFDNQDGAHPVSGRYPPKSRFIPSKHEGARIKRLVRLIRMGKILPPKKPQAENLDLWGMNSDPVWKRRKAPIALQAPKVKLPGHAESYNPPEEYLFTQEEKKEWEEQDETERKISFIPKKYDALRKVPAYPQFITERFHRCLDLYLVPRALKQQMNVNKESLLPKLPSPSDLRPFPMRVSVHYKGHTGLVRMVSTDCKGQLMATASDDCTCRIWDVSTGYCVQSINFEEKCVAVAFCPGQNEDILAVGIESRIYFVQVLLYGNSNERLEFREDNQPAPTVGEGPTMESGGRKAPAIWHEVSESEPLYKKGCRLYVNHDGFVSQMKWHKQGNYLAIVSKQTQSVANQCVIHALNTQKSMKPFGKVKGGAIQSVSFHPNKPYFFACSQRSVRMYDLQKQQCIKQLLSGSRWISSITVHKSGDHVVVGTYDRRIVWFDLDFSTKAWKSLHYHNRAVRDVEFHNKFPLLASCSDDGNVHIMHAKVYNDIAMLPLLVPVKKLTDHKITNGIGVMNLAWHPIHPWVFSVGADNQVFLWV